MFKRLLNNLSLNNEVDRNSIITCRICMMDENKNNSKMICPCKCNGSIRFVHPECLDNWINSRKKKKARYNCQICFFRFQTEKIFKPLKEWEFKRQFERHIYELKLLMILIFIIIKCVRIIALSWEYKHLFYQEMKLENFFLYFHFLFFFLFIALPIFYGIYFLIVNFLLKDLKSLFKINSKTTIKDLK